MDKPAKIFHLDETGMPLKPKPPQVVTVRGVKHATAVSTGNKSQITALSCCNAACYVIPPLIIFQHKGDHRVCIWRGAWYSVWPI